MLTRIYPKLESGQIVTLSKNSSSRGVLRALVPSLVLVTDMFDDVEFYVIEVGERRSVARHVDGCRDSMSSDPKSCRSCSGMLVTFDTDIWIGVEVDVQVHRKSASGETKMVTEKQFYHSRRVRSGEFISYLSSEQLDLSYEEVEVDDEEEREVA